MKALIFIFALFFCFTVSAEWKVYHERYKDIEAYDYDFQVYIDEDTREAKFTWNWYLQNRGFQYYKLMYSSKYANPSYPEQHAAYVGDDINTTSASLKLSNEKTHYFRICSITDEGYGVKGRYCSSPRKFVIEVWNKKEYEYKKNTVVQKTKTDTEKKTYMNQISTELQKKIDDRLEEFFKRLEAKYQDETIVMILEDVLKKIQKHKSGKNYAIVMYMETKIEAYINELEDELDIFESIFQDYE